MSDKSLADTIESINKQDPDEPTHLRAADVNQRMQTKGGMAKSIKSAFGSVESLLEAIEADAKLTDYDGIGPKTAQCIKNWYENRFEREKFASSQTMTKKTSRSATITFHKSWEHALGMDGDD